MRYGPVVLADDLTGSCDVGAECLRAGYRVRALMASVPGWEKELRPAPGEILVVDLESRRLGSRQARIRARYVGSVLAGRGIRVIYFKMDSTLRGNWAEEGDVLRGVLGSAMVWLVPANPGQGRTTLGGHHFVMGRPIESTEYATDPLQPVKCGNVLEILGRRFGRGRCAWITLSEMGRGPIEVGGLVTRWIAEGVRWVAADAQTQDDLRRIAESIPGGHLVFGAASLARFIVRRRGGRPPAGGHGGGRPDLSGRWLAVIGSLNPLTQKQVGLAGRRNDVKVLWLKPGDLASRRGPDGVHAGHRWLVLALDRSSTLRHLGRIGSTRAAGESFARMFARFASVAVREGRFDGCLFSGGLTAACMCEELGIKSLNLQKEIMPGLVISSAAMNGRNTRIITKPGGFGAGDCLLRIAAEHGR